MRLDVLIVERGLAPSRERAQAILLAGNVLVNGQKMEKPGSQVAADARVEIIGEALKYASRGGLKLEGALEDFGISPLDRVCLDVGSSTGGFTDCLLQRGAARVYRGGRQRGSAGLEIAAGSASDYCGAKCALFADEGYSGASGARDHGCVIYFRGEGSACGGACCCAWCGVFDIDQAAIRAGEKRNRQGRDCAGRGLHQKAIERVQAAAIECGLTTLGVQPSHLPGTEGNQEFFLHARARG